MSSNYKVGDRVYCREHYSPEKTWFYGTIVAEATNGYNVKRDDGKEGIGVDCTWYTQFEEVYRFASVEEERKRPLNRFQVIFDELE